MTEEQKNKLAQIKFKFEDLWNEIDDMKDELKANLSDENYQDFEDIGSLSGSVGECHRKTLELMGLPIS